MELLERLGPFSLVVLSLAVLGLAALPVLAGLTLRGRRIGAPAWILAPAIVVGVGLLGGRFGVLMAIEAAGVDDSTWVTSLLSAAAAYALEPALLGCVAGGALALLSAYIIAALTLLQRTPPLRWSFGHALVPALLGVVGAPLLAHFAGAHAAVLTLAGAFPCVLVALRCATREQRREPVGRALASARLSVALLAPLGALALAQALRIFGARGLFQAVGFAAANTKLSLLEAMQVHAAAPAAVLAVLVVAGVAAAMLTPVARAAWDRRTVVGGVVALVLCLPAVGARATLMDALDDLRTAARPWYLDRPAELAADGLELPRSTAVRGPERMLTLSVTPGSLSLDGLPLSWEGERRDGLHWPLFRALDAEAVRQSDLGIEGLAYDGKLLLQVHRELTWEQVEPLLRTAVGARFSTLMVATSNERRELRVFELELVGETHPEAGSTQPAAEAPGAEPALDRFVSLTIGGGDEREYLIVLEALDGVWRVSAPGMEPGLATDTAELSAATRRIKDEYPDQEDILLVPDPDTSWQELVAAVDAVRGSESYADTMFPYPRLELSSPEPGPATLQP